MKPHEFRAFCERTGLDPSKLRRRAIRALTLLCAVSAFDLALGLILLGYAALEAPTLDLLRGGLILAAAGLVGLVGSRSWRRHWESLA